LLNHKIESRKLEISTGKDEGTGTPIFKESIGTSPMKLVGTEGSTIQSPNSSIADQLFEDDDFDDQEYLQRS
jgi:hypothetical protein